jgi:4-hydroxybenzoate polyprenyltransferase
MKRVRGLIQACHFAPSLMVTTVAFLIAQALWWEGPAYVIAIGVLLGQLVVGWTNDLHDYEDDLKHNRTSKPLVSGLITPKQPRSAIFIVTPLAVIINLCGPLGLKGGAVYLLGIGFGLAYNFYFKYNLFSWLPYALAFAALPSCVAISKGITPPIWMWLGGAIFGSAAHFINVIKDMDQDRASGIGGAPQRLGKRNSIVSAIALIGLGILALFLTI